MANQWNRSSTSSAVGAVKTAPRRSRGLLAGLAVVAVGLIVVLCFFFSGGDSKEERSPKERGRIKDVAPAVSSKSAETNAVKKVEPKTRPTRIGEEVNGYVMLADRSLHKVVGTVTNNSISIKGKYAIFPYRCDNELAGLLCAKPGAIVVGEPSYGKWFTKEFLKSLSTPIVVTEDDDEFTRKLKKEMVEAKAELKAAYDRGEDIAQIMTDSRKELRKLMDYNRMVNSEIVKYKHDPSASAQDVEDFVNAANKMLEAKGIAPLHVGPITRHRLNMERKQALQKGN